MVECNPRRSAQSGNQIRYKEYNRSSWHGQRLARYSAASQESWARRNSQPNVGPRNVYLFMASGTECDQISFGIIPPDSMAVAPPSYWARLRRFSPGSNRKRMSGDTTTERGSQLLSLRLLAHHPQVFMKPLLVIHHWDTMPP